MLVSAHSIWRLVCKDNWSVATSTVQTTKDYLQKIDISLARERKDYVNQVV